MHSFRPGTGRYSSQLHSSLLIPYKTKQKKHPKWKAFPLIPCSKGQTIFVPLNINQKSSLAKLLSISISSIKNISYYSFSSLYNLTIEIIMCVRNTHKYSAVERQNELTFNIVFWFSEYNKAVKSPGRKWCQLSTAQERLMLHFEKWRIKNIPSQKSNLMVKFQRLKQDGPH